MHSMVSAKSRENHDGRISANALGRTRQHRRHAEGAARHDQRDGRNMSCVTVQLAGAPRKQTRTYAYLFIFSFAQEWARGHGPQWLRGIYRDELLEIHRQPVPPAGGF